MNYKMMQGMILVTWGGGVIVGSPQGDLPISTVHAYVNKKMSYSLYLVPYGTIVDPSQVSLCLIAVDDSTPPGLESILVIPF